MTCSERRHHRRRHPAREPDATDGEVGTGGHIELGDGDGRETGYDFAERAGKVPAAAELLQQRIGRVHCPEIGTVVVAGHDQAVADGLENVALLLEGLAPDGGIEAGGDLHVQLRGGPGMPHQNPRHRIPRNGLPCKPRGAENDRTILST